MNNYKQTCTLLILALVVLATCAMPVFAERIYVAEMTGEAEVPSSSSTAFGIATMIMSDDLATINYTVSFAGLDGVETAAAFCMGSPGTTGPSVLDLPLDHTLSGEWNITSDIAEALIGEAMYVNIFSDLFPNGEIRGDFALTIVETDESTWSGVKALFNE